MPLGVAMLCYRLKYIYIYILHAIAPLDSVKSHSNMCNYIALPVNISISGEQCNHWAVLGDNVNS